MGGMVNGIRDGSIQYSTDVAGGVTQGLLLYYMGASANRPDQMTFALDYMRHRLKRLMRDYWSTPVAPHYLGEVSFGDLLAAATRQRELAQPLRWPRPTPQPPPSLWSALS